MPCENLALYSYIFTPKNTLPSAKVTNSQPLAAADLLALAASRQSTIETLEQMSTKVLNAPIGSLKCTSAGLGHVGAPKRSTMYVPIKPAKNMISVDKNNQTISLPLGMGSPG